MVDYRAVKYDTLAHCMADFKDHLLRTSNTTDYFVNWSKVYSEGSIYPAEVDLLNTVTQVTDTQQRKNALKILLAGHPQLIEVLPRLLAERKSNITVATLGDQIVYEDFVFNSSKPITELQLTQIVDFCERTGIVRLLGNIKDTRSYLFGTEVGLDTNGRKNRSGKVFERLIDGTLRRTASSLALEGRAIKVERQVELGNAGIHYPGRKKVDFLVSTSKGPLVACEVNVYNGTGSKPSEIIRTYKGIQDNLKASGVRLLWLTDGPGWLKTWGAFERGVEEIDFVMNYWMAEHKMKDFILHLIASEG